MCGNICVRACVFVCERTGGLERERGRKWREPRGRRERRWRKIASTGERIQRRQREESPHIVQQSCIEGSGPSAQVNVGSNFQGCLVRERNAFSDFQNILKALQLPHSLNAIAQSSNLATSSGPDICQQPDKCQDGKPHSR